MRAGATLGLVIVFGVAVPLKPVFATLGVNTADGRFVPSAGDVLVSSDADKIGSFRMLRVDLRSLPQSLGCPPQRKSENAQGDCSQPYKGAAVFIGECPDANIVEPSLYDRAADNATTFAKGLVLFCVLAGIYAIGKRFGLLDDEPDRSNRNHRGENPK